MANTSWLLRETTEDTLSACFYTFVRSKYRSVTSGECGGEVPVPLKQIVSCATFRALVFGVAGAQRIPQPPIFPNWEFARCLPVRRSFPCSASSVCMTIAIGDSVTLEYTGRLDDGTVFDTSREQVAAETGLAEAQPDREYTPLTVEVGANQVIEGMDEGLVGLEVGETETLSIPPEKAYGEPSEEHIQEFESGELQQMLGGQLPEQGDKLEAQGGQVGDVVHVDDEVVRVDFNPELAGESLEFEVEILQVN